MLRPILICLLALRPSAVCYHRLPFHSVTVPPWCGEGGRWDDARQAVTAVCEPPGSLTPLSCKHPHTAKFPLPSPLPSLPLLFRVYHCPPEQQIKRGGMVMQGTQQRIPHRRAVRLADKRRAAFHSALTAALHRIHADFLAHVFPPAPQSQPTLHLHPSVPQSRRQASPVAAASGRGLRGEESQHGAVGAAEVGSEEKDEDEDEDEGSTVQRERRMKGKRRLETAGDDIEENGQGTEGDGKKQGRSGVKQSADSVAWHVDFPFEDISVSMLLAEAASFHSSQHTDAHTHAGQGRGGKGGKGKQQREAFVGRQSKQRRKGGAAGDESAKTGEVEEGAMEGGEGAEKGGKKRGDGGCGGDEGWDDETGIGAQRYTPPCPPRQLKKVPSCNVIAAATARSPSLLSHLASSTPHDSCAAAARQSACQHRSTALLVLALTVCGSLCCCLQERAGSICCTGLAACRGVLALYAAPALLPAGACWLYMLHRPCCSKERQWREEAHGGAAVGWCKPGTRNGGCRSLAVNSSPQQPRLCHAIVSELIACPLPSALCPKLISSQLRLAVPFPPSGQWLAALVPWATVAMRLPRSPLPPLDSRW
ncbi:unnamed protein product [Closterium sp. NIES-65]|nr:unnamed protein product [Closterium sp. NIES-65]